MVFHGKHVSMSHRLAAIHNRNRRIGPREADRPPAIPTNDLSVVGDTLRDFVFFSYNFSMA